MAPSVTRKLIKSMKGEPMNIPKGPILRLLMGLVLIVAFAAGTRAYAEARDESCFDTCGGCVIMAIDCDSCDVLQGPGYCAIASSGCADRVCACGEYPEAYECFGLMD
jgi:hypothetical protein